MILLTYLQVYGYPNQGFKTQPSRGWPRSVVLGVYYVTPEPGFGS